MNLIPASPNATAPTWVLLPGRTNLSTVNIASYLDGWSQELECPGMIVAAADGQQPSG